MRGSYLLLAGIFMNFFGWQIVEMYVAATGVGFTLFLSDRSLTKETTIELILIFICCVFIYFSTLKKDTPRIRRYRYTKGALFFIILLFFFFDSIRLIITTNFSMDTSTRGVAQFERGIGDAVSRIRILVVPALLFFRIAYRDYKQARFVSLMFVVSQIINSISYADRRMVVNLLIAALFVVIYEVKMMKRFKIDYSFFTKWRVPIMLTLSVTIFIGAYIYRVNTGTVAGIDLGYYPLLQGLFGSLGFGGILIETKHIVDTNTGFLWGASFFTYFATLLVPSAALYFVGADEFLFRSSFEFDRIYNDNPNMGYDYMMVADFYWNFGYLGYAMYLGLFFFISRYTSRMENRNDVIGVGSAALMTIYFVAGQRSDFGFFLKSIVFSQLFLLALNRLAKKKVLVQ